MDFYTEQSLINCKNIASLSEGTCFLMFSRGKDSVAAWLYLRNFFKRIIPFYLYDIPDFLSFEEQSLAYYEDYFGIKIERFLDGNVVKDWQDLVFQSPLTEKIIDDFGYLKSYTVFDIVDFLRKKHNAPKGWCAASLSLCDNLCRRTIINTRGAVNYRRMIFYPCFDWTKKMILDIIKKHNLKLAPDYLFSPRSFSFRRYSNLMWVFKNRPDDFKKIEQYFPMIKAAIVREELVSEKEAKNKEGQG